MENIGPVDAVKRSGQLLKQTWGEQLVGNAGMGLVFFFMFLGLMLVGIPLIIAAAAIHSVALIVAAIALLVVACVGLALIASALSGIYTATVYNYAVTGRTNGFISDELVRNAFRTK